MNKRNFHIFLLIISIIIFVGALYYLGIFSGKILNYSQDPEGVFGEVVDISVSEKNMIVESGDGEELNIEINDETEILNLYNRSTDLSSFKTGNVVRVLGDVGEDSYVDASKIRVVDTDSNSEITIHDKEKTFTYSLGLEFSVILNDFNYSLSNLSCSPSGVVSNVTDTPGANPPYYAAEFEAVSVGQCKLENNDFSVDINVEE